MARNKRKPKQSGRRGAKPDTEQRQAASSASSTVSNDTQNQAHVSKCNSISWYAANPALLQGSASLSWLAPMGAPWSLETGSGYLGKAINDQYSPAVCVLHTVGVPGVTGSFYSPVNIAARNIYSWIRHANSGGRNYEAQDLAVYLLTMDEIYAFHSFLKRVYGVAQLYTVFNRYYPKKIVEAMGVDFDDVINNLADFRYYINSIAVRIGSFAMPNTMSYFERHKWMYEGLYVDSTSVKAQTYMFSPFGYRVYQEPVTPGESTGLRMGTLRFKSFSSQYQRLLTVQDMKNIMQEMITPVSGSEDLGIMSGDIIKAFGVANLMKVETIDENYQVLPSYDLEVLSQIQNATVFPQEGIKAGSLDITTNSGQCITCNPTWDISGTTGAQLGYGYCAKRILNMYKDVVIPDDTMIATRLTAIAISNTTNHTMSLASCGSDICCGMTLKGMNNTDTLNYVTIRQGYTNLASMFRAATDLSAFDFHPMVLLGLIDDEGKVVNYIRSFQLNNTTVVGNAELTKMHETALLSQFTCPQVGA